MTMEAAVEECIACSTEYNDTLMAERTNALVMKDHPAQTAVFKSLWSGFFHFVPMLSQTGENVAVQFKTCSTE